MLNIFVVGGFSDGSDKEQVSAFCKALGIEIAHQGHVLISGCRAEIDRVVAEAFKEECPPDEINDRLRSYVLNGVEPFFNFGRLIRSGLESWDPGVGFYKIPEVITDSDVVVLIKGGKDTRRSAFWAQIHNRPLLPVTYFAGASSEIYKMEMKKITDADKKSIYERSINSDEYEVLNLHGTDWENKAKQVVNLAEKVATSRIVFVAMSFSGDEETQIQLENVFETYKTVCEEFQYECELVNELTVEKKITDEIFRKIDNAAFGLIDLTDLKPNVFFEFGYGEALNKKMIITAKENTKVPFDVKDFPVIKWNPMDLKTLKEKLREKIEDIARLQGRL